jgi:hypothetical protein
LLITSNGARRKAPSNRTICVDTSIQMPSIGSTNIGDKELGDPAFPSRSATAAGQRLSCDIRRYGRFSGDLMLAADRNRMVDLRDGQGLGALPRWSFQRLP